jgi:hypothetical protein
VQKIFPVTIHLDLAQIQNGLEHLGNALQKMALSTQEKKVRNTDIYQLFSVARRSATDQPLDLRDLHESSTRRSSLTRHVLCRSVEVGWSGKPLHAVSPCSALLDMEGLLLQDKPGPS